MLHKKTASLIGLVMVAGLLSVTAGCDVVGSAMNAADMAMSAYDMGSLMSSGYSDVTYSNGSYTGGGYNSYNYTDTYAGYDPATYTSSSAGYEGSIMGGEYYTDDPAWAGTPFDYSYYDYSYDY